jgi:hypothetical protein
VTLRIRRGSLNLNFTYHIKGEIRTDTSTSNYNAADVEHIALPCKLRSTYMFQGNVFVFFTPHFIYLAVQVLKVIQGIMSTLGINETFYVFPLFYVVEIVSTCRFDISGGWVVSEDGMNICYTQTTRCP